MKSDDDIRIEAIKKMYPIEEKKSGKRRVY